MTTTAKKAPAKKAAAGRAGAEGTAAPSAPPRAADTPPKGQTKRPGRPSTKTKRAERAANLADQLTTLSLGLALLDPRDAAAVGRHAEAVADALAELADQNRMVARLLDGAAAGGALLGVFTALLPLVVELLANHGRLGPMSAAFATPIGDAPAGPAGAGLGDLLATFGAGPVPPAPDGAAEGPAGR